MGEDVFPFRTREICEAERRMANLDAELKWLREENKLLEAKLNAPAVQQCSASSHTEVETAVVAESTDISAKDTGTTMEYHKCEECGKIVHVFVCFWPVCER
jgi:hypothetical protein